MSRRNSTLIRFGNWLLSQRWWFVSLGSLSVLVFEFLEYMPFTRGLKGSFFFEIIFYAIFLPASTGLALTGLAASRTELAWSAYYQNLKRNLELQLHNTHSHEELAQVFLQFVKVVVPLAGATFYKYNQNTRSYKTILYWSLSKDSNFLDPFLECGAAQGCQLSIASIDENRIAIQPCRDPHVVDALGTLSCFCIPFLFSDSLVAGARLYFQREATPSPDQIRLVREVVPEIAAAFHRVELEYLMKKRDDHITLEQQRSARDVHDSLGHSLAYLRLKLDLISMEFNKTATDTLRNEVETLRDLAKEAYDQMRDILVALSQENHANLTNALLQYIEIINGRSSFKVHGRSQGQPRALPASVQRHIFFIFREALTNIERHAQAREVCVELNWQESELEIDIDDDGSGFDVARATQNGHFGLKNMQARANEINAQLSISSFQPGHGTLIQLRVPYEDTL